MNDTLFTGDLVRLGSEDPKVMAEAFSHWYRDGEYTRLLESTAGPLWSAKKFKEIFEKDLENDLPTFLLFSIRTIEDDKLIGFVAFEGINWRNADTFAAIGIGERDYRGKGYGTDAMRLLLRYGFTEMNLHRISLSVFEYNTWAIRSYEKCGFQHEGCEREFILRDGKRWDMLYMGILRSEWNEMKKKEKK
jgi:RimJ/RimL family protein N-acetyltransferase